MQAKQIINIHIHAPNTSKQNPQKQIFQLTKLKQSRDRLQVTVKTLLLVKLSFCQKKIIFRNKLTNYFWKFEVKIIY